MMKHVLLWFFLFYSILHSQTDLQNYMTISVIDSIAESNYNIDSYTGYYDVHLATNGTDVYLATKKMYRIDGHAQADLLFGTRQGMGKWQFETVANYADTVYREPLSLIVMHDVTPVIFFVDRPEDLSYYHRLYFTNLTGTGWVKTLLVEEPRPEPPDYIDWYDEHYQDGFSLSTDQDGVTAYWCRMVMDTVRGDPFYWPTLMAGNWSGQLFERVQLPSDYSIFARPVVTKDGEYVAFSVNIAYSDHSYWCIYVYRKSGDQYVRDFADSTISDAGWYDYLNGYSLAIGKKPNGDVMLVANGNLGRPIYLKSGSNWTKIVDNYPTGSGVDQEASNLELDNERLFFSNDGTAFWGAFDAYDGRYFYTDISYMTPDGQFGHFTLPSPPEYPSGGIFQAHDFVITSDDTLHFVYEYQPPAGHPKCLVEGKVYVPDILQVITAIHERSKNSPNQFKLAQNFPNPFNPATQIAYYLPIGTSVRLTVYDVSGRQVSELVNGFQTAGHHMVTFDATNLPGGVYFYRLEALDFSHTRKMVLLK